MSYRLDATEVLVAELIALRAAVKQLVAELSIHVDNPAHFLSDQFNRASEDLASIARQSDDPNRAEAMTDYAREVLEEIYTVTVEIDDEDEDI